jgi:hypothetical protein
MFLGFESFPMTPDAKPIVDEFVTAARLAKELGVSRRTLGNWLHSDKAALPQPARIRGRLYFSRTSIELWKIQRAG